MVWNKMSLRIRIFLPITALVIITVVGAMVMIQYTYRMEDLLAEVIDHHMEELQTVEAMELALVNQKGFASYYFMDQDPKWLMEMEHYRAIFLEKLEKTRHFDLTEEEIKILDLIKFRYMDYIAAKNQVVDFYKSEDQKAGTVLHEKVRENFFTILDLCETYKNLFKIKAQNVKKQSLEQAEKFRIVAGTAIFMVLVLAVMLIFFLVHGILEPLRRLALETDRNKGMSKTGDEVKILSNSVHDLIREYDQTQVELEKSREHLLQSEKMALVGNLAAGTSHSIRNPLTSVKMRLFSLSRSLDLDHNQKEDFDVISEEIGHIDNILENFLEFSRPPRLKLQLLSPSDVVDQAVQLLEHRLKSYEVVVIIQRTRRLPRVKADPEQLKEVLVNIIVNACEEMGNGGSIVISEEETTEKGLGRVAAIRLKDDGPGISKAMQEKIFQPFFTTKEEGTGLGLSIATRIIEEHHGRLYVESKENMGSTFVIVLPIKESSLEQNSNHRR
jgi:signal transduction histidine kinase